MKIKMISEIGKGGINKFEINQKGYPVLDRVLTSSMKYPEEYGFIPETIDFDGDSLDVLCLIRKKTFFGCEIPIRIIGVLKMTDEENQDDKIIAVNSVDHHFDEINDIKQLSKSKLDEISHFFLRYKEIEKKKVKIIGYEGKEEAIKVLEKCLNLFQKLKDLNYDLKNENKKKTIEILKKIG